MAASPASPSPSRSAAARATGSVSRVSGCPGGPDLHGQPGAGGGRGHVDLVDDGDRGAEPVGDEHALVAAGQDRPDRDPGGEQLAEPRTPPPRSRGWPARAPRATRAAVVRPPAGPLRVRRRLRLGPAAPGPARARRRRSRCRPAWPPRRRARAGARCPGRRPGWSASRCPRLAAARSGPRRPWCPAAARSGGPARPRRAAIPPIPCVPGSAAGPPPAAARRPARTTSVVAFPISTPATTVTGAASMIAVDTGCSRSEIDRDHGGAGCPGGRCRAVRAAGGGRHAVRPRRS